MLDNLFSVTKFIPNEIYETIYDIDFNKLYDEGKKFILFDLDNTLLPYDIPLADAKLKELLNAIQNIGFIILIVSNNSNERVTNFCNDLSLQCITKAKKPLNYGFKKALKKLSYPEKNKVISVGDQLMTDVLGAKRVGIYTILVKPLKKSNEKWYTRYNRKMEKHVLKRIKKYNYNIYREIEEKHEY